MECPKCGSKNNTVLETRIRKGTVMRRRKCDDCGEVFKTYEVTQKIGKAVVIIEKDGRDSVYNFSREKLAGSIFNASYDSDITLGDVNRFVNDIEFGPKHRYTIDEIFELTCEFLKKRDYKSYVRYALSRKDFIENPKTVEEQI